MMLLWFNWSPIQKVVHIGAHRGHAAHKLVADGHRHGNGPLRPLVLILSGGLF